MLDSGKTVLVTNSVSTAMGRAIAEHLCLPFTELIHKQFSDGERYLCFPESISGKDLVIVGATPTDEAHQDILDLIHGGRFWNARSINLIIPYLGYSTMERAKPGTYENPKGITRTRQIFLANPHFVAFVDLHSEAVLHAHDGHISTKHVWTDQLVVDKIREIGLEDYVLVSPDYGFSKRVARIASLCGCPHTAADKDRYDIDKTIVGSVSSVVRGKTALICDDMIRTGGSILQTAERCLEAGAADVMVLSTHLVLSGNAREKFAASPVSRIIGSDSYPGRVSDELLEVYSLAPLLAEVIEHRLTQV